MFQAGQIFQFKQRSFCLVGSGVLGIPGSADWTPWTIPLEARFVSLLIIGPGAGGAAGVAGTSGTSRNGGGGGGAGGVASGIWKAKQLPQTLYFYLPPGGAGGSTSGQSGGGGGQVAGTTTATNACIASMIGINTGGSSGLILQAPGGTGATNTAGPGGSITQSNMKYLIRAIATQVNAQSAGGSSAGNPGSNVAADLQVTGGAGGGSTSTSTPSNGGSITSNDLLILGGSSSSTVIQGGLSATPVNGNAGWDNFLDALPFGYSGITAVSYGGSGGASSNAGQGGNGGNGGIGSGGGGGGAGVTGQQGTGGNGGPAFAMVEWW